MILINDDYFIETDEYNYCVMWNTHRVHEKGKNKGEEIVSCIGYFSTLKGALRKIYNHCVTNSTITRRVQIERYLNDVRKIEKDYERCVNSLKLTGGDMN